MLLGVKELHVSPEGIVSDNAIVPEKPFRAERVIEDVAEEPVATDEGEVALTAKSLKLKVVDVKWTSTPLVAVIVNA